MINKIFISFLISIIFLQPVNSAMAFEGLIKFTGLGKTTVFLEVAATDEEKQRGLMNRSNLPSNRGMVFVFRPERKVTFWMKDTLIPLDMIFINRGKIVNIAKNALPNQTTILYPSQEDVTEVVEVNGGFAEQHNVKVGDLIIFENIAQIDYSRKSKLMILSK